MFSRNMSRLTSFFRNCSKLHMATPSQGIKISSRMTLSSIEDYYNQDEKDAILRIVNETNNPDDFSKYLISKKKIDELVKMKSSSGFIKNLEDLITIIGLRGSSRFFCSLLDRPSPNVGSPMFPIPTVDQVAKASTILSINITGGAVSWCKIRRKDRSSFVVESLAQKPLEYRPKMHFLSVLNEMNEIASYIPKAEVCVIDEYPNAQPNPYMFTFQLQMTQMRSFLLGSLTSPKDAPQILSIKSIAVGRMFNTYIGSERVSGQHMVDNIMIWKPLQSLLIPDTSKAQYINSDPKVKEGMSSVLLLNLAYWKLTKQFTEIF